MLREEHWMLWRYIQTNEGESVIRMNKMLNEDVKMCTLYQVILGWSNQGGGDRGDITPATERSGICIKNVAKPTQNRHLGASRRRQHNITMDLNLWKATGYVMHQQVYHSRIVRSPHTVFMCFVFIWEQTATCATYIIKWLVFITEMKTVFCAVQLYL